MSQLFDLSGRLALVTGSSRGIGRELAKALADAGATIILHGRDAQRLDKTAAEFAACYGAERIHSVCFDVTDDAAVRENIAAIEKTIGPIRILVNNAGIQHRVPMLELEVADW